MMIKSRIVLFFFLTCATSWAQLSKTHFIPPITVANNGNATPGDQFIQISTPSSSVFNVHVTEVGGLSTDYSVSNSSPLEILVGSGDNTQFIANPLNTGTVYSNKGYIIQADEPIFVSVRLIAGNSNQAGSIVSKGLSAMGNTFRIGSFTNLKTFNGTENDYLNFMAIMATENNTAISITDLPAGLVVLNDTPSSAVLQAGETLVFAVEPKTASDNRDGLIGALVDADKPVVVNCGSFNGSNDVGSGRDAGIDQIAPLETIAVDGQAFSEYIFIRGNGYDAIERPLIVAHFDDTEVWLHGNDSNGTLLATLSAGEYVSISGAFYSPQSAGGNMYVWTSKTAFAYQGVGGTASEPNQELFFVPPINCKTPQSIDLIPDIDHTGTGSASFNGGITIVAETGADVYVNGILLTASLPVLGNANFVSYLSNNLTGNVTVTSDGQIYVSYFGANGAAALGGFYSGFIFKPEITSLPLDGQLTNLCIPNVFLDLSSSSSFDSYQWYYNDIAIAGETNVSMTPTVPGFYQLEGVITDCDTILSDIIPVSNCSGDYDDDGVNDNLDVDLDNDGILNLNEADCNVTMDLSSPSGSFFSSVFSNSTSNTIATPAIGFSDQSIVLGASSPTSVQSGSTTSIELIFTTPTSFTLSQAAPISGYLAGLDDNEQFIISVPYDQTVTVLNPDNQLLIDTNFDGIYDNNIESYTGFEIRCKLNMASLAEGDGTFSFRSHLADGVTISYQNFDTSDNFAAFVFSDLCHAIDSDNDAVADWFDLDSDQDGIYDVIESGNSILGYLDGMLIFDTTNDSNDDGAHDLVIVPIDSDADEVPNHLDLDSDNDGIFDLIEAGGLMLLDGDLNGQIDPTILDNDNNGTADIAFQSEPFDSNTDGQFDFVSLDSDGDGCYDADEAGYTATSGIINGNAINPLNGTVSASDGYVIPLDANADGVFDYTQFVEVTNEPFVNPLEVCENSDIEITAILSATSSSFDAVIWEYSIDNGLTWFSLLETAGVFENIDTPVLSLLNIQTNLEGYQLRPRFERLDYTCDYFYGSSLSLIVNPIPVVEPSVLLYQCDDDTDGLITYNITEANELISTNYQLETFTYYYSSLAAQLADATLEITNPETYENLPNPNTSDPNQIYVRITSNTGCISFSQMTLLVSTTQIPSGFSIPVYYECFDESDDQTTFDFSDATTLVLDNFPINQPLSVSYYTTYEDALSELNSILDPSNFNLTGIQNSQIWLRVDSLIDNACVGIGQYINLEVLPLPLVETIPELDFCIDQGSVAVIDLASNFDAIILGSQLSSQFSVSYFQTEFDALSSSNQIINITNSGAQVVIFGRIENTSSGCFRITPVKLNFIDNPIAHTISAFNICDIDADDSYVFDTSTLEIDVLNGQTDVTIAYFDENGNPLIDLNGVPVQSPFPSNFETNSQTITAVVSNGLCPDAATSIVFEINPSTTFSVDDTVICDGIPETVILHLDFPSISYNYMWLRPDGTMLTTTVNTLNVNLPGNYEVTVSNQNGSCPTSAQFEVSVSQSPMISVDDITVIEASSNNSIFINELSLGSANYQFMLVDQSGEVIAPYQDEGYFDQLLGGIYTLFVRDDYLCSETSIDIPILNFPLFITPNGDGYNDVWMIQGITNDQFRSGFMYIFDRFGKLIKSMSIFDYWDGTYNGANMPTSDYWYRVEMVKFDGSILTRQGHFTLKR